jgi:hypothetical protein
VREQPGLGRGPERFRARGDIEAGELGRAAQVAGTPGDLFLVRRVL